MLIEFPHKPPEGYTYEIVPHKRNVLSIWICNHAKFSYTNDSPVKSIWGFYDTKKGCYYAPVNSSKCGDQVSIENTTPYSAMSLKGLPETPQKPLDKAPEVSYIGYVETRDTKPMPATAQEIAQSTIQQNVVKWSFMLCEALRQNYIDQAIRGHMRYVMENNDANGYHNACITDLSNGYCGSLDFQVESGRKYHKIIFTDGSGSRSVHCFVDKNTGEVYKSASWKQPAKGVRFDLRLIKDREWMFENCDWAGGYLYAR